MIKIYVPNRFKKHKDYSVSAYNVMVEIWMGAISAFTDALINNDWIHVDTGMSKASVLPLAEKLRMGGILRAQINSKHGPRLGYTDLSGNYHPNVWKSIAQGKQYGKQAAYYTVGTKTNPRFYFRFKIMIYQWQFHEGPDAVVKWNAINQAKEVFMQYITSNKHRITEAVTQEFNRE